MLIKLRNLSSLSNLYKGKPSGQIATMLILVMVAILIFIIVTVNIGKVSIGATIVSNAVDTAVLSLASQLATKSHSEWAGLNQSEPDESKWVTERHKYGGFLGIIAAIGAVIAGAFTFGLTWAALPALLALGAMAGALGQAIATRSLKGAVYGALMGASIALAAVGGQAAAAQIFGTQVGVVAPGVTAVAAPGTVVTASGAVIAVSPIATAVFVAAGIAFAAYSEASKLSAYDESTSVIMEKIDKINDDYIRMRESILFQALSMTVDDPGKVQDALDIDGDGDTDEQVLRFLYNYYTQYLPKVSVLSAKPAIKRFQERLKSFVDPRAGWGAREFLRWIHRREVECSVCSCPDCPAGCYCGEGPIIEFIRSLKECKGGSGESKYGALSFWEPLPDRSDLLAWYDCDKDEGCPSPPGFDEIDFTHYQYEEFIGIAKGIISRDPADLDRDRQWLKFFFRPEDGSAGEGKEYVPFFEILNRIIEGGDSPYGKLMGMNDWYEQLWGAVGELPRCQLEYGEFTPNVTNENVAKPCGPAYDPESQDPNTRFYPCVWRKSLAYPGTGPYFPNFPCSIDHSERDVINQQLGAIAEAIDNDDVLNPGLLQKLKAKFEKKAQAACEKNCLGQEDCTCTISDFDLKIDSLSLTNSGKQSTCYKGPLNSIPAVIDYTYYYTYNCERCCEVTDANGKESTECTDMCIPSPCREEGTGKVTLAKDVIDTVEPKGVKDNVVPGSQDNILDVDVSVNVTDIVGIPEETGDDAVEKFLTKVTEIKDLVDSLSMRPPVPGDRGMPFVTIDADSDNEFCGVSDILGYHIREAKNFLTEIGQIYNVIKAINSARPRPEDGHSDLVSYEWTDSTGTHKVTVQTGPFKLAHVVREVHRVWHMPKWLLKKTVWSIENYCENTPGCPYKDRAWVKITREDPANQDISPKKNVLGKWNPFSSSTGKIRIIRKATAAYSYNSVSIASKENR